MQKWLLLATAIVLSSSGAFAEHARAPKTGKPAQPGKSLPLKRPNTANACAEYGAGFVMIEGTATCVKIGGAIGIGAGVSSGAR